MIALVIIRRTHKAHKTDRGAENPMGPKLPDFTLDVFSPAGNQHQVNVYLLLLLPSKTKKNVLYYKGSLYQ